MCAPLSARYVARSVCAQFYAFQELAHVYFPKIFGPKCDAHAIVRGDPILLTLALAKGDPILLTLSSTKGDPILLTLALAKRDPTLVSIVFAQGGPRLVDTSF